MLNFWKNINESTCEFTSVAAVGAWNEADKLDDTDDDDDDNGK